MRRTAALVALVVVLSGCTATMREGHPEDIPQWWRSYRGPDKHLNVIMEGHADDDVEYFQTRCADWGGMELVASRVDRQGNVLEWTCTWVDF